MNKNFWELYKNSEKGKEAIALFTFKEDDFVDIKAQSIFQKFSQYFGGPDLEDYFIDNCQLFLQSIILDDLFIEEDELVSNYFERLIDNLEINLAEENDNGELIKNENELPLIFKKDYRSYCAILSEISLVLYFNYPNEFFPILFREEFDMFMKILDVLGITLPDLPSKSDKRGRLLLYKNINENITEFAKKNNLTSAETCACLYDFAFLLLEEKVINLELPKPSNIWLTGGSKGDYKEFLENPVDGNKSVWTCNENTKRGDIIIMYVLSPYSCIQSIWRADIDGVYTPFNFYNSRTKATNGILVPHISLKELKEDSYFSKLPITRKNFQGVNGVKFSAKDYQELQRILLSKDFDITVLPQLFEPNLQIEIELNNEKDVEEKLLIPLLEKLEYFSSDWSRQLSQKAGRTEKAIPDFVFFPKGDKHFQNAPMVIEAKFDMNSNIEQTKTYNQALSYARLMKSEIFGICDKERLIIYVAKKGFFNRFNPTFEQHWQNLNNAEIFNELKTLIGKNTLNKIKKQLG